MGSDAITALPPANTYLLVPPISTVHAQISNLRYIKPNSLLWLAKRDTNKKLRII
jgi:hypothetical protein